MRTKLWAAGISVVLLACPVANGQVEDTFEAYTGSADGVEINGQGDYYNPVPDASVSAKVYTYAGNTLGLPANPSGGGLQFVAGTGPGDGMFSRSQRDHSWGDGTGVWLISYDLAITFVGDLPSVDNVGSFSGQPFDDADFGDAATIIGLITWTDDQTAANWNADFVWFEEDGSQVTEEVADAGFQGLDVDKWYRLSTRINFDTNAVMEVSITDKEAGTTVSHNPVDRYLDGGAEGGLPTPTGFRMFAGNSGQFGNVLAFDNLVIELVPVNCGDGLCDTEVSGESCCTCEADCGGACVCGDFTCEYCEECDLCVTDCGVCDPCTDAVGDCCDFAGNGTPGCEEFNCCSEVCGFDPFCCSVEWDGFCAFEAAEVCQVCGAAGPHTISTGGEGRSHDGYLEITPGEYGAYATVDFGGGAFGSPGDLFNPSGPLDALEAVFTSGIMLFVGEDQRILLSDYNEWAGIMPDGGQTGLSKDITEANAGSDTNKDGVNDTVVSEFEVTGTGVDLSFVLTQYVYTVVEGLSSELSQEYVITNNGGAPIDFTMVATWDGDLYWDEGADFGDDEVGTEANAGGTADSVFEQEESDPATRITIHIPGGSTYYGSKLGVDPSECETGGVPYGYGTDFQIWDSYGVPDGSDGCDPHECSGDGAPCDPDDLEACPTCVAGTPLEGQPCNPEVPKGECGEGTTGDDCVAAPEDCDPTNPPDASDWRNNIAGVGYNTDGTSGADPPGCGACDASCGVQINVSLAGRGVTTVTVFHTYGVGACVPEGYADICLPYCPEACPQPDIDDILCLLDDFADGPGVDGCACNGFRSTTDLDPCPENGGGDGVIGIDDILEMLDQFGGSGDCGDPCPF